MLLVMELGQQKPSTQTFVSDVVGATTWSPIVDPRISPVSSVKKEIPNLLLAITTVFMM